MLLRWMPSRRATAWRVCAGPLASRSSILQARRFVPIVFALELQRERVGMFAHDRRATFRFVSLSSPRP